MSETLAAALAERYRVERELGQGGMATVYLAQDLKHQRRVAIKVLRPELAAVIGAERFLREIRTIVGRETLFDGPFPTDLYHPNYDVAPDGQSFIMLRPLEEGRRLIMAVNWTQELRQRLGSAR